MHGAVDASALGDIDFCANVTREDDVALGGTRGDAATIAGADLVEVDLETCTPVEGQWVEGCRGGGDQEEVGRGGGEEERGKARVVRGVVFMIDDLLMSLLLLWRFGRLFLCGNRGKNTTKDKKKEEHEIEMG